MRIQGTEFGPQTDFADVIRRRMAGEIHVQDDPHDPTLHAWLGRLYQQLRATDTHRHLGRAFASLIADETPLVREAVAWFLRGWPDDPAAPDAARTAFEKHRELYVGFPDTLGNSPAGLEGELIGAVGKTVTGADDPLLDEIRAAALKEQMLGPCLPALATHDPLFLVREAAALAAKSPYWIRTLIGILDKGPLPMETRWIAPRSDIVARIARSAAVPPEVLQEAIKAAVNEPRERRGLLFLASSPGEVGDYRAEDSSQLDLDGLRQRCLEPGGVDGAVLKALSTKDPGFPARALGRILRATPGALGPILAWASRHGLDLAQTTRRVHGLGLHGREEFLAVSAVCIDRSRLPEAESAWLRE